MLSTGADDGAATAIQRVYRGHQARVLVHNYQQVVNTVCIIQRAFRRFRAKVQRRRDVLAKRTVSTSRVLSPPPTQDKVEIPTPPIPPNRTAWAAGVLQRLARRSAAAERVKVLRAQREHHREAKKHAGAVFSAAMLMQAFVRSVRDRRAARVLRSQHSQLSLVSTPLSPWRPLHGSMNARYAASAMSDELVTEGEVLLSSASFLAGGLSTERRVPRGSNDMDVPRSLSDGDQKSLASVSWAKEVGENRDHSRLLEPGQRKQVVTLAETTDHVPPRSSSDPSAPTGLRAAPGHEQHASASKAAGGQVSISGPDDEDAPPCEGAQQQIGRGTMRGTTAREPDLRDLLSAATALVHDASPALQAALAAALAIVEHAAPNEGARDIAPRAAAVQRTTVHGGPRGDSLPYSLPTHDPETSHPIAPLGQHSTGAPVASSRNPEGLSTRLSDAPMQYDSHVVRSADREQLGGQRATDARVSTTTASHRAGRDDIQNGSSDPTVSRSARRTTDIGNVNPAEALGGNDGNAVRDRQDGASNGTRMHAVTERDDASARYGAATVSTSVEVDALLQSMVHAHRSAITTSAQTAHAAVMSTMAQRGSVPSADHGDASSTAHSDYRFAHELTAPAIAAAYLQSAAGQPAVSQHASGPSAWRSGTTDDYVAHRFDDSTRIVHDRDILRMAAARGGSTGPSTWERSSAPQGATLRTDSGSTRDVKHYSTERAAGSPPPAVRWGDSHLVPTSRGTSSLLGGARTDNEIRSAYELTSVGRRTSSPLRTPAATSLERKDCQPSLAEVLASVGMPPLSPATEEGMNRERRSDNRALSGISRALQRADALRTTSQHSSNDRAIGFAGAAAEAVQLYDGNIVASKRHLHADDEELSTALRPMHPHNDVHDTERMPSDRRLEPSRVASYESPRRAALGERAVGGSTIGSTIGASSPGRGVSGEAATSSPMRALSNTTGRPTEQSLHRGTTSSSVLEAYLAHLSQVSDLHASGSSHQRPQPKLRHYSPPPRVGLTASNAHIGGHQVPTRRFVSPSRGPQQSHGRVAADVIEPLAVRGQAMKIFDEQRRSHSFARSRSPPMIRGTAGGAASSRRAEDGAREHREHVRQRIEAWSRPSDGH